MTNPNNAVGTNGAFGGRTSVNAFNDVLGTFRSRGILSGWGISPSSGMTVNVGGNGTTRDVAVAEDANGNKTTINNISASPIAVTLDSAPASNSRYDAIVAYVDKPPVGNATQDNPECCGIIPVTGTAASTPAYPGDGAIRSAITADGASGSTAYYVVLGYILVASGTTTITSGMITAGAVANLASGQVDTNAIVNNAITSQKIDFTTFSCATIFADGQALTQNSYKTIVLNPSKSSLPNGVSYIQGNLSYDTTNSCITVGAGINAIEVSASVAFQDGTDGQSFWAVISYNDTVAGNRIASSTGYMKTGQYLVSSISPVTLAVHNGDKIRLLVYTNSSTAAIRGDNAFTYLTVKQVG